MTDHATQPIAQLTPDSAPTYPVVVPGDTQAQAAPPAAAAKPRLRAVLRSFTGFEEHAVATRFGAPWEELSGTFMARCAQYIQLRRTGMDDTAAYNAAMNATIADLEDTYDASDEEDDTSPEA